MVTQQSLQWHYWMYNATLGSHCNVPVFNLPEERFHKQQNLLDFKATRASRTAQGRPGPRAMTHGSNLLPLE